MFILFCPIVQYSLSFLILLSSFFLKYYEILLVKYWFCLYHFIVFSNILSHIEVNILILTFEVFFVKYWIYLYHLVVLSDIHCKFYENETCRFWYYVMKSFFCEISILYLSSCFSIDLKIMYWTPMGRLNFKYNYLFWLFTVVPFKIDHEEMILNLF